MIKILKFEFTFLPYEKGTSFTKYDFEINLLPRKFYKGKNAAEITYQFKHESFRRAFVVLKLISSGD
jgi:hypothetical protein